MESRVFRGVGGRRKSCAGARGSGGGGRIGVDIEPLAKEAAGYAVEKIFTADHPLLADYTADGYTAALEQIIRACGRKRWCSRTRIRCEITDPSWPLVSEELSSAT